MELTVTPKAQKWFDSEIDLPETYGIRFFGKVYGKTEVHDGFSIGMSVEQPEHPVKKVEMDGTLFLSRKQMNGSLKDMIYLLIMIPTWRSQPITLKNNKKREGDTSFVALCQ